MGFEEFIQEYLGKGLIKRQKVDFSAVEKLILRSQKDLEAAKANLVIDEGIAFSVAYLAMLHAGRAFMLLKGFRHSDGAQHRTVGEFIEHCLSKDYKTIVQHFDSMRRKRNIFTYEVDISISGTEAKNALDNATKFVKMIKEAARKENPQAEFKF